MQAYGETSIENFDLSVLRTTLAGIFPEVECHPISKVEFSASEEDRRWLKLGIFKKEIANLEGTCLFLDLDVVVTDSIDEMFDFAPSAFCISHDWWMPYKHLRARLLKYPKIANTSVFRFEAGTFEFILSEFERNHESILEKLFFGTGVCNTIG